MPACCNTLYLIVLSNMYFEQTRLCKYITSKRNPLLSPHQTDNQKMTAWHNDAKSTVYAPRPNWNMELPFSTQRVSSRIQCHPSTINHEDQASGKNFSFVFHCELQWKAIYLLQIFLIAKRRESYCGLSLSDGLHTNARPPSSRAPKGSLSCVASVWTRDGPVVCVSAGSPPRTVCGADSVLPGNRNKKSREQSRGSSACVPRHSSGQRGESNRGQIAFTS